MPLPFFCLDATWRHLTPGCPECNRLGGGLETPGVAPVCLSLTRYGERDLVNLLALYLNWSGGVAALAMDGALTIGGAGHGVAHA